MSEPIKEKNSEQIKKLSERIEKIEIAVKAALTGIRRIEIEDIEEERIANGEYLGVDFKPDRCDW